jgi:uncharacterized membrane protein
MNEKPHPNGNRSISIDFLRALAIIIMVFANTAPYIWGEDAPWVVRFMFSWAAPMFIFLAGYSSALGKSHNPGKLALRGVAVLAAGVFIDVFIWQLVPFVTFDVLYLLGISLIISALLPLNIRALLLLSFFIIVAHTFVFDIFPYRFEVEEIKQTSWAKIPLLSSAKRCLWDGWFPLIPWLALVLVGRAWALMVKNSFIKPSVKSAVLWSLATAVGIAVIASQPEQPVRDGYLEVFYPAKIVFLITTLTGIVALWNASHSIEKHLGRAMNVLALLGRHSMFIYFMHAVLISFVLESFLEPQNTPIYFLLVIGMLIVLYGAAKALEIPRVAILRKRIPPFIHWMFGF